MKFRKTHAPTTGTFYLALKTWQDQNGQMPAKVLDKIFKKIT